MKKKVLALVMTLAMLASLVTVPAAAAGGKTFPDAVGHWAEESILRWSRSGLVKGDEFGNVNPGMPLRRCEMATIISDMLGLRTAAPISTFRDIDGSEWYARAILRCAAAGIMEGNNGMSYPQDNITREEAIKMISVALRVQRDEDPDLSEFTDGDSVSGWAAPYMATLTELGILDGMGDGRIAPHENINRAGAFTLMDKAISVYANAPGTYNSKNANGFVVINSNAYEGGDVVVTGKANGVLVSVGATNTVRFRDFKAENVIINGKGDVVVTGKSNLDTVAVDTGVAVSVDADATVDVLNVNVEKASVTNAGTVKALNCPVNVAVKNSGQVTKLVANGKISLTNTGTVDNLVANAGLTVDNTKGTVKNAEINVGGVVMDGPPQQMTLGSGVARPTTSSGRPISATGTIPAAGGGGGGGGGGGSSKPPSTVDVEGVTLSPASWVMNEGTTTTLTATVAPSNASNKTVTWKSSNPDVAAVDSKGVVTAVAEGKATITVTTASGSKTAQCVIDVRAADDDSPIPVKSVSFDKSKLELTEEETATLTLIIDPANATKDGAAKWESSDTSVVEVDQSGNLKAVKPGTATIKATITVTTTTTVPDEGGDTPGGDQGETGDNTGETENPGENTGVDTQAETTTTVPYTAECEVIVKAKPVETVAVTGVTLNKNDLSLEKGETATLTATVAPGNATNQEVTWKSSDNTVATVENGTVTAKGKGTATITVTTADGGKTADCEVTVTDEGEDPKPPVTQTPEIKLDQTTLSLKMGETVTGKLNATVTNAEGVTVSWSTDTPTVATVEDGTVTAVSDGTAKITATITVDGTEYSDTCTVTVAAAGTPVVTPGVTSVNVTPDTASMEVNETKKLEVTVAVVGGAEETVTWSSSDESVATVDGDGLVTAVRAGTATITATSTVDTSKNDTCEVTVTAQPEVTVTEVTIDPKGDFELTITDSADGEKELTAIVKLSNGDTDTTKTVTWSVTDSEGNPFDDDEAVVSVTPTETTGAETVTVKAVKGGTAKVVVTVTDGDETLTCSVTVKVTVVEESGGGEEKDPEEEDETPTTPPEEPGTEDDDSTSDTGDE